MLDAERAEALVEPFVWHRRPYLGEPIHPLVVVNASRLEFAEQLFLRQIDLGRDDDAGRLQHGLDDRERVEGVVLGCRVERVDGLDRPERQRLVQCELVLEVKHHPNETPLFVRLVEDFKEVGIDQRAVDRDRALDVRSLLP
ncbi:MAG: hypothetical protein R2706_09685 [Acidimicrobiales bacterium]